MLSADALIWVYFAVVYSIYYLYAFSSPDRAQALRDRLGHDRAELTRFVGARLFAVLTLGILPWITMPIIFQRPNADWGLRLLPTGREILIGLAAGAVAMGSVLFNPNKKAFTRKYPQMRIKNWGAKEVIWNLVTWILYLAAYEGMFRGYLLFSLKPLGMWPALAIVQALYIIIHLPFGTQVTAGTIPFGIAVGWLCWNEESFWIALIAHIAVAWTHSIQSAKLNPEMRFLGGKTSTDAESS